LALASQGRTSFETVASCGLPPLEPIKCAIKVRFVKPCEFGVKVPRVWAEQFCAEFKVKTENGKV